MQASGQAQYETTAALAETESSTAPLAERVHHNAEVAQDAAKQAAQEAQEHAPHLGAQPASHTTTAANVVSQIPGTAGVAEQAKGAAEHAASVAHEKGPAMTGDPKDVVPHLKARTDAAAEEGKKDVDAAITAGQGYLQQAMDIASGAVASARQYLASTTNALPDEGDTNSATGSSNASSAMETAKQYATRAQNVAQPHIEAAAKAIQSGATSTIQSAQEYLAKSYAPGSVASSVPSKTAPLESGLHTSDEVYSEGSDAKKLGETA
ncbi:hypothetical protein K488DRAFT_84278 [Vararia minispora EC-137]|uniref:Uncharacterized protein n=1 Tax=Vararia minispora EC-137 TaxID=1314806 RepID=A0ACB8QS46_9AGAM|nr:hypothetical protein K488DRAFT_84278 [Vararia minispora EC-137]